MSTQTSLPSHGEIDRRVAAAQRIKLDVDKVTTVPMKELIKAHANAIGSPIEFIFFPLLSIASHFMGPDTRVKVNEEWKEPLILWNVVLADKGQKKSPALNRFLQPIKELEMEMQTEDDSSTSDDDPETASPQIYIEHFSMEELHYTLKRNNGRVVGLYDEISLLYEQLDKYKNGSSDRKTILSLINRSPWRRNFRSSNSVVPNTWFNIAGFVQPDVIVSLMNGNDYDGFCDRQFFVCPPELDVDYDELQQPPRGTPSLKAIFKELDEHHSSSKNIYSLHAEAHVEFVAFHDELNERKREQHRRDRDRKSILSKAKGQVVRLAAVTFALHQATNNVSLEERDQDKDAWSFEIPREFLERAILLMNFCIEQKFCLGKPKFSGPTQVDVPADNEVSIDEHRVKRLLELGSPVTVTKISQAHIQKRVDNKYRKEEAEELMKEVVSVHLGDVVSEEYQAGKHTRTKQVLVKRKVDELTEESKDLLKKLKVDMDKYAQ